MLVRLTKDVCAAVGPKNLKPYGYDDRYNWSNGIEVDLAKYSRAKLNDLKQLIVPFATAPYGKALRATKGANLAVRDINSWFNALKEPSQGTPRNAQAFYGMVKKWLLTVPGQRLYLYDEKVQVWWCYYVSKVKFSPEQRHSGYTSPAYTTLYLHYVEFGQTENVTISFSDRETVWRPVSEMLAGKNYLPETDELRAQYLATTDRFKTYEVDIGRQFMARGFGNDDLDGNPSSGNTNSWWGKQTHDIRLERNGELSRVVIDVFKETDEDDDDRRRRRGRREDDLELQYWQLERKHLIDDEGDIMEAGDSGADEPTEFEPPEVPIHPTLAVFDLRKHLRLRVHVDQVTLYEYDTQLGDKLVLPADDRALVDILLQQRTAFADVIGGKGGGSVVLCAGAPGLGKTLTAEIYAEVTQRPLYTVQCSQLGLTPDELEDELLKCFARAERWNAILLLDEADVYVAPRGDSLEQNAIVGVFLRTLEYYNGTLFMTTNRVDLVDDAVASRCIAKLTYRTPTPANQARIWRVLADTAGVKINKGTIKTITEEFTSLSGRDVKNLLKLASLVAQARGEQEITIDTVRFVKRFKPTRDLRAVDSSTADD